MDEQLNILIADDEELVSMMLSDYFVNLGHTTDLVEDGVTALDKIEQVDYDLALLDVRMPGVDGMSILSRVHKNYPELPVVIMTGHGNMQMAIEALRLGAADFLTKPIDLQQLGAVLEKALRLRDLQRDRKKLRDTIRNIQDSAEIRGEFPRFVGESAASEKTKDLIQQAVDARCDTILITGETGTGKEVVAREIHLRSQYLNQAFIAVSCPAIPDNLIESELFGHTRGSFTGATKSRAGCFELANEGTLFLDEISDLSPAAQAKLLRVLEARAFRRIGSSREIRVNLRIVAATNARLEQLVSESRFRNDLFYRLNVFNIHLKPLRERIEDIIPLAEHFLNMYQRARGLKSKDISEEAQERLIRYDYPGNARELRNIIERAAILSKNKDITTKYLNIAKTSRLGIDLEPDSERNRMLKSLHTTHWNRREAAKLMNMPYSTFRYKMQKYRIE